MKEWIWDPATIEKDEIKELISNGVKLTINFTHPDHPEQIFEDLNQLATEVEKPFTVRFTGSKFRVFDGSILKLLPNISQLTLDNLASAKNLNGLGSIKNLTALTVGIKILKMVDFLKIESLQNLKELTLDPTKSDIDLSYLANFTKLKLFVTNGSFKNINSLAGLISLKVVYLLNIREDFDVSFISNIRNLKELNLLFGKTNSIEELQSESLKRLEIVKVGNIKSFGDLGRFPNLKKITLSELPQLEELDFTTSEKLTEVNLLCCEELNKLSGYSELPELKRSRFYKVGKIKFKEFITDLLPETVKRVSFGTGIPKKDKKIDKEIKKMGYKSHSC